VRTTDELLARAASAKVVKRWPQRMVSPHGGCWSGRTNHVDLMRIDGIGLEHADLLEAVGVDSVPELTQRNAAKLAVALERTNERQGLARRVPSETVVASWIAEAKTQPKVITH
jgi:hypothetical protein